MDKPIEVQVSTIDYSNLLRETLNRLKDSISLLNSTVMEVPHLINLVESAIDYSFYLEDSQKAVL